MYRLSLIATTKSLSKKDILLFQFWKFGNRAKTRRKSGNWKKLTEIRKCYPPCAPPPNKMSFKIAIVHERYLIYARFTVWFFSLDFVKVLQHYIIHFKFILSKIEFNRETPRFEIWYFNNSFLQFTWTPTCAFLFAITLN